MSPKEAQAVGPAWGTRAGALSRWGGALLLAGLPALVLVLLVYWAHGQSILEAVPPHADDFRQWLNVLSFRETGFASGYFVHNEIPARWTLTPYAADGPWYSILFAGMSLIGGWSLYSGVVYNLVFMSAALAAYALFSRAGFREVAWLAGFISLMPLMPYSALSTSYVSSYLALGLCAALLFRRMLDGLGQGVPVGALVRAACALLVFAASVYKVDWALLLFPTLMLGRRGARSLVGWGAGALSLCLASASVMLLAGAPIGTKSSTLGFWGASSPLLAAWQTVQSLVAHNMNAYLEGNMGAGELLAQAVGLLVLVYPLAPGLMRQGVDPSLKRDVLVFNAFNIGAVFVLINTLYIPYAGVGEKYVISHTLVSVFSQSGFFTRRMRVILLGCAAVMFLLGVRNFESRTLHFFSALPEARAREFSMQSSGVLRYTPGADRWCNTVLTLNGDYPPEMLGLPPGLGYSAVYDPERLKLPLKSRYVIHDGSDANRDILEKGRFRPLLKARFGTVYENLDSPCPRDASK